MKWLEIYRDFLKIHGEKEMGSKNCKVFGGKRSGMLDGELSRHM
jgi:hypothetical protein